LCLQSDQLKDDNRLNDAFHNNPPLTAKDNRAGGPVQKFQQALLDAGEKLPKFGPDGNWGQETSSAVTSFQARNGVPPGGFEAGRKTLLALDQALRQTPPPPPPSPGTLAAQCGTGPQAGLVLVSGGGFNPGDRVELDVDGTAANSVLVQANGAINGTVSASSLKDGSHVVTTKAGGTQAAAQFDTPCGGQVPPGPQPDPNVVTQNELLVLTEYQFLGETEKDAIEDAIRDLNGTLEQNKLDPTPVPWGKALANIVGETVIQFIYGAFEQAVREAVKKVVLPAQQAIVDNAHDKASDFLQDFGKDGLKQALDKEDQAPTVAVQEQVERFRRIYLASIREGYLKLEENWIQNVPHGITPDGLQGLRTSLAETSRKLYDARYLNTLQGWDSYIAHAKLGGTVLPPDGKEVKAITDLSKVGDKDPKDVPGVLLIGLNVPDAKSEANEDQTVHVDQNDTHIFGMSETTRQRLADAHPQLVDLHMPVVLRGKEPSGGFVVIGRNEQGGVLDAGSDEKGKIWLIEVGQAKKRNPALSDPNVGAQAVFSDDLDATQIEKAIQGP
jgi:hypothetical protein